MKTPIVRARLVARHIAARYGGKDILHELFAAMPPFEMIKFLLRRAVQGISRCYGGRGSAAPRGGGIEYSTEPRRKVMFINVSKAHLYAPTSEEDDYFVERKLYPNVDFYSGIIFKAIGIPETMFTVLFAVARTVGWISQWNEMIEDPTQKIGRPRQLYLGLGQQAPQWSLPAATAFERWCRRARMYRRS